MRQTQFASTNHNAQFGYAALRLVEHTESQRPMNRQLVSLRGTVCVASGCIGYTTLL